jgi:pyruvate kinase
MGKPVLSDTDTWNSGGNMLQATLPEITRNQLVNDMVSHPLVAEVRYNVGAVSPYSPKKTLGMLKALSEKYGKRLWLDLKGKQLRVKRWSARKFGRILLNHELTVDCPAEVYFRGDNSSIIKSVKGSQIFIDPPPRFHVGEGQAINIIGKNLSIKGYLTADDKKYLKAACELGIFDFMLSFIECESDVVEVENFLLTQPGYHPDTDPAIFVYKIETMKGLNYIAGWKDLEYELLIKRKANLMAARDDLMTNIGPNKFLMLNALGNIIRIDRNAILASRIFSGLESIGRITMGDISDLKLMRMMGYRKYLLSDGICQEHFAEAMQAWEQYLQLYGD